MKRIATLGVALGFALALASPASAQVKFGVGGPITGPNAATGAQMKNGVEQAAADINLRLELPNVTGRGLKRTVLSYPGPRNAGGAPSLDDRDYDVGQMVYFRIRKTLGG